MDIRVAADRNNNGHVLNESPLSFYMAPHYGSTQFYTRRYDEALRQLTYALGYASRFSGHPLSLDP